MNRNLIIGFVVAIVLIVGVMIWVNGKTNTIGTSSIDLNPLAQCLTDKGVKFYGAFWCPHCQATKRMFGDAKSKLNYVECSTPDGNGQTQICIDQGIKSYPTWRFPDGSELKGEQTAEALALKAGCPVPGGVVSPTASSTDATTTGASSSAL